MSLSALLTLLLLSSTPPRLAAMPLTAGEGVTPATATSLSSVWVGELRKATTAQVLSGNDLAAVMGLERQKALLGCDEGSCFTELGGALDAQEIVTGTVSRLGESWLLQVQRIDAKTGTAVAYASRRKRGEPVDALLDELPGVARELLGELGKNPPVAKPAAVDAAKEPPPSPLQERPFERPHGTVPLVIATDGKGRYIVVETLMVGGAKHALFAGDENRLFLQRTTPLGEKGGKSQALAFWDPRFKSAAEASFSYGDGKLVLTCGAKKVRFKALAPADAQTYWKTAKPHDVRFGRRPYFLARDGEGQHYYVDQAREPETNLDFHLYTGTPGKMTGETAEPLAHDSAGDLFRGRQGKLRLTSKREQGEWLEGDVQTKLTVLPVETHQQLIFTTLGVYAKQPLGTPCDG